MSTNQGSEISSVRMLGGIGSILVLLSPIFLSIPFAGAALGIVGLVLVLVALRKLSDITRDESIFRNALISVIIGILSVAVFFAVIVGLVLSFLTVGTGARGVIITRTTGYPGATTAIHDLGPGFFGFIVSIIVALAILWVLLIVSSYFLYRSYKSVALHTGIGLFSTAGLLYVIGSALAIILVGLLIMFIAGIIQVVAFFTIPERLAKPGDTGSASQQPAGS